MVRLTMVLCGVGFAQTPPQQTPPPVAPEKVEAPKTIPGTTPVDPVGLAIDPKSYVIGPEDILYIRVFHDNDFTGPVGVRPDGKITLPLIGDVQASGLTPERLATQLKQAISQYIIKPDVTVSVSQVNSKKYYLSGEVNRAGGYPLVVPTTVFEALNNAFGFKDFANKKNIIILRVGGKRFKFNYNEYIKGKRPEQNILLENGDTIIVK
jgi:polysaccharide export outer membrane protein